jgi:hypothetical protein
VIIPSETAERFAFYQVVTQACNASRGDRRRLYQTLRNYYMYGSDGSSQSPAKYNKIYPHVDKVTSFLYSQETTRFSTDLGVSVSSMAMKQVGSINKALTDEWNNSNMDIMFGMALTWAHVYASTFIKLMPDHGTVRPGIVDPHNFGVYREDVPSLDAQEACTHTYYITRSQLEAQLKDHPRRAQIMASVTVAVKSNTGSISPLDRIITSASSPNVIGNLDFDLAIIQRYMPKVREPMVEMNELYVWDDEENDYRIVTLADPYEVVYDRPLGKLPTPMYVKGELPFIQVCPIPAYDYFFGYSEVERLVPTQDLLNMRWEEIRHIQAKQARPPKNFSGFQGITDEIALAFDTPDGYVQSDMPGSKVESLDTPVSPDLWADIDRLEQMFDDTSGINNVMEGKGEAGVRSTGHAAQLARLGSARVKKRAMIVEDSLEKLATMMLKVKKIFDSNTRLRSTDGSQFAFDQFTDDCIVKVDAHSNSPIFVEDNTNLAFTLFKMNAITKERLIELINVPMKPQLADDIKNVIEPAEAAKAKEQHDMEVATLRAKQQGGRR